MGDRLLRSQGSSVWCGGVAAVRANGLVKRFDATCALDQVDMVVEPGEVRGLLGPNGAGKTTLLRILLGLLRPDAGSVELFDLPLRVSEPIALSGVAGFVEEPSFYPYLSGRTNLELLAELDGDSAGRIDEVLDRVGLGARAGDRVAGYSSGMRQRLGIAAALLRAPRLLLLDEPTAGLDPAGARDIQTLIRELAGAGAAVVLSSHQIAEVEGVCDSFTVIRRGNVVWAGSAADLRAQAPASAFSLSTSDDVRALEIADRTGAVRALPARSGGLTLSAEDSDLDAYAVALGRAGVAIRRLELLVSPLESMFFALTADGEIDPTHPVALAEQILARA
jgi:ABC-2 type transport system ATP-binding protein